MVCTRLRSIDEHHEQQQKIKSLDELVRACRDQSELFSLFEVLTSVRLYRNLGRQISKITTAAVDQLLEARGLDKSKRWTIHGEIRVYKKWDRFCGECEGILCFVPPVCNPVCNDKDGVSRRDVKRMENADIDVFRSRLLEVDHAKQLCEVGKTF